MVSDERRIGFELGDLPVAVLAGGLATRLGSLTAGRPKSLVDVAGRPFIEHQVELLRDRGLRHVVLCLGHLGGQIEALIGDGHRYGMDVRYSYDGDALLGTAGALRRAMPLLGEVFCVIYGDSYLDIDYAPMLATFLRGHALGLLTVVRNENRWGRSNAEFLDGRLIRYDKRHQTAQMRHTDFGAAILTRAALDRVPADEPSDLADVYATLVADGSMIGYEVEQRFYEIGSADGLADTSAYIAARQRQP